jgi:hypothetical protein
MEYRYSTVTADGTTIDFTPPADGRPAVVLPQDRVFSREYGMRLPDKVGPAFFGRLIVRPRLRSRVGVVEQQQLHRTP